MAIDAATRGEILETLETIRQAYRDRDPDTLLSMMTDDIVSVGTGADEIIVGKDQYRVLQIDRDFSQSDALDIAFGWIEIASEGPVAWCVAECMVTAEIGGAMRRFATRMTAVFRRIEGRWLLSQSHLSFPSADQPVGESFPAPA